MSYRKRMAPLAAGTPYVTITRPWIGGGPEKHQAVRSEHSAGGVVVITQKGAMQI